MLEKKENKISEEMKRIYKRSFEELDVLLADLYVSMMEDGGITPANFYKYDRYTALQATIAELARQLGHKEEIIVANFIKEMYAEEFREYADAYYPKELYQLTEELIENAVKTNWSGEHFSSRIWNNKQKLVEALDKVVIDGIALGVSRQKMNAMILKQFETQYHCADRIIRTESNFIYNRAHFDIYEKAGVMKYEFLAELDSRTSDKCASMEGKEFYLAEAQVGWNYPPLHPNCRSTVMPVIKDKGEI